MNREAIVAHFNGDEELVEQLVELFVDECPRMMNDVRHSIESGNAEALRRAAHSFKGCVGNFGDTGAVDAARSLEVLGRERRLGDARKELAWLEREVNDLLQAMQKSRTRT